MSRFLVHLLINLLGLLMVVAPASAALNYSFTVSHFLLELAGDSAGMLTEIGGDSGIAQELSPRQQKKIRQLLGTPIGKNFVHIGRVRAQADAKQRPVPLFPEIKGAKEQNPEDVVAWSEKTLAVVDELLEQLEAQRTSMDKPGEKAPEKLKVTIERLSAIQELLQKLLKAASESKEDDEDA